MDAVSIEIRDDTTDFRLLSNRIKALTVSLQQNLVPYATKEKCMKELEVLDKKARLQTRIADRNVITAEMNYVLQKASETKAPFIVHVFKTSEPIEFYLLWEARKQCKNVPALLIATSGGKFIAAVTVPADCLSEKFDSGIWMQQLGDSVKRNCKPQLKDNHSICNLRKYKHFSDEFGLDQAVEHATEYARKNCPRK